MGILTSCNVLTNFKDRNKLKKCLIESTIETLERQTIMEPLLSITNTTGTPITKKNFKKVSLCAKTITKKLSKPFWWYWNQVFTRIFVEMLDIFMATECCACYCLKKTYDECGHHGPHCGVEIT